MEIYEKVGYSLTAARFGIVRIHGIRIMNVTKITPKPLGDIAYLNVYRSATLPHAANRNKVTVDAHCGAARRQAHAHHGGTQICLFGVFNFGMVGHDD